MSARGLTTVTAALAVLPLALAAAPAATAGAHQPGRTQDAMFANVCTGSARGEQLLVRMEVSFAGRHSNDIKRVVARATDNGEHGNYRNRDVRLVKLRIKVVGPAGKVTVYRASRSSPFRVSVDPDSRKDGRNARSATVVARWKVDGHRTAPVACFYLDGV